jgi:hypothetical protein
MARARICGSRCDTMKHPIRFYLLPIEEQEYAKKEDV